MTQPAKRASVLLSDGREIFLDELDAETGATLIMADMDAMDVDGLMTLRDRMRALHEDAAARGLDVRELAMLFELELKGRRLNGREVAYVIAAGIMVERSKRAARMREKADANLADRKKVVLDRYAEIKAAHPKLLEKQIAAMLKSEHDVSPDQLRRWRSEAD